MIRFRLAWLLLVLPPLLLQVPSPILNVDDGPMSSVGRIPAKGVDASRRALQYAGLEIPGEFSIENGHGSDGSTGHGTSFEESGAGMGQPVDGGGTVRPTVVKAVRASSECLPYDANAPPRSS